MTGNLPWSVKTDFKVLQKIKEKTSVKKPCKRCPHVLGDVSDIIFGLVFDEKPPYEQIKNKIDSAMKEIKSQMFVWERFPSDKWKEISVIPMKF
jgi:coenzyme F420-reducing hydrogenase beta subunit